MFGEYNDMVWFLIGVFTYRTLSAVLTYGHLVNFVTQVNEQVLVVLGIVSEDLSFAREIKYKNLHQSGLDEQELTDIKEIDDRTFAVWRNSVIGNIKSNFPSNYKFLLKYKDWDGAMKELDRIYKSKVKSVRRRDR